MRRTFDWYRVHTQRQCQWGSGILTSSLEEACSEAKTSIQRRVRVRGALQGKMLIIAVGVRERKKGRRKDHDVYTGKYL